jgi:hypothetical protein
MTEKKKLPTLVSDFKKVSLKRIARYMASDFHSFIYPVLLKFGLLDEVHVKKYLTCETTEEIYNDALAENPDFIKYLDNVSLYGNEDVWAAIRDKNSPVKSPKEEGFIFAPMPGSESRLFKSASKTLYLEDGKILVDDKILENECIITPTDRQQELYEMVKDFCDALKEKNYHKNYINSLFMYGSDGIMPNIQGIIGTIWVSIKK